MGPKEREKRKKIRWKEREIFRRRNEVTKNEITVRGKRKRD